MGGTGDQSLQDFPEELKLPINLGVSRLEMVSIEHFTFMYKFYF